VGGSGIGTSRWGRAAFYNFHVLVRRGRDDRVRGCVLDDVELINLVHKSSLNSPCTSFFGLSTELSLSIS